MTHCLRRFSASFILIFSSLFLPCHGLFAELSESTQGMVDHFDQIDAEISDTRSVAEMILRCSFLQDAWLAFLYETPSEEFLEGMTLLDEHALNFHYSGMYATDMVNFYNPGAPRVLPQTITLPYLGTPCIAFLNTFKSGKNDLSPEERKELFLNETIDYLREGVVQPFELRKEKISHLRSGTLYNFVLLPDGTLRLAEEKEGGKQYFSDLGEGSHTSAYPNHTILAGSPQQPVIAAGSILPFSSGKKQLFFVSHKSGHFLPYFSSLGKVRDQLEKLGVNPHTVILTPSVDLGDIVLTLYRDAQIPLAFTDDSARLLWEIAHKRWKEALDAFDTSLISELAEGNFSNLDTEAVYKIEQIRQEATAVRSAYNLFSKEHAAPEAFHEFVKRFGKLKDAIKHNLNDRIVLEANKLLPFLQDRDLLSAAAPMEYADEDSMFFFLSVMVGELRNSLYQPELPMRDFHDVKKRAREMATLFFTFAEKAKKQGRYYFVYRAAAFQFLRVNDYLAQIHDVAVGRAMRGEISKEDALLTISDPLALFIERLLNQLGIAPPVCRMTVSPYTARCLMEQAMRKWNAVHINYSDSKKQEQRNLPYLPELRTFFTAIEENPNSYLEGKIAYPKKEIHQLLRSASPAAAAYHFLSGSHEIPEIVKSYLGSLQQLIDFIEERKNPSQENPHQLQESESPLEASYDSESRFHQISEPLDSLQQRISSIHGSAVVPEEASAAATRMLLLTSELWLPNYLYLSVASYTNQQSFDNILYEDIATIHRLSMDYISEEQLALAVEQTRKIRDLLTLYLALGQQFQSLPTSAYESAVNLCNQLLKECKDFSPQEERKEELLVVPTSIRNKTEQLIKKLV